MPNFIQCPQSKLFIPRKNYLESPQSRLKDAQDELANYLAIENYINRLVCSAAGGGLRYSTVTVGAASSAHNSSGDYDFFCTGTGDSTTLTNAVNQAISGSGTGEGQVLLMDGVYKLTTPVNINGCDLVGMGTNQTQIELPSGAAAGQWLFGGIRYQDFNVTFLGDTANDITIIEGAMFINVQVIAPYTPGAGSIGILCDSGGTGVPLVLGSSVQGMPTDLSVTTNGAYVAGNFIGDGGLANTVNFLSLSTNGTKIIGNDIGGSNHANGPGILFSSTSNDNLVQGNRISSTNNGGPQVKVNGARNNVQGNTVRLDGGTATYGIEVEAVGTDNLVTNNDLKTSGATSSFNDLGTGTITTAGNRL